MKLYNQNPIAYFLTFVVIALLCAAFAAGIVAIYIVHYHKPKLEDPSYSKVLLQSLGIASLATFFVLLGSVAGYTLYSISSGVGSEFPIEYGQKILIENGIIFFLEVLLSIFLTNRLLVNGYLKETWQKVLMPTVAFFVFAILNMLWKFGIVGLFSLDTIVDLISFAWAPFNLIYQAIIQWDITAPFRLIWQGLQNTLPNQFALAETLPSVFFIFILAGAYSLFSKE